MYKAVIFDLDGTLLNTLDDLADSTNFALEKNGFPTRTIDEVRRFVGNGNIKLIHRALPDTASEAQFQKTYSDFTEHYKTNMANKTKPYDGINDLLKNLYENGVKLAIVTNKIDFAAQELCGGLFGDYVKTVIGSDGVRPNKPAPDGLYLALENSASRKRTLCLSETARLTLQLPKMPKWIVSESFGASEMRSSCVKSALKGQQRMPPNCKVCYYFNKNY